MLPVLIKFTFDTPLTEAILYILAAGLVVYGGYAGWRGAESRSAAPGRAVLFAALSAAAAWYGAKYALSNGAPLHTYGLMIASGFLAAITVSAREAERSYVGVKTLSDGTQIPMGDYMREVVMDIAFYVLVSGILGSRILFIIVNWEDYAREPSSILSLSGGLVFYGGLIGAGLTYFWYCKAHQIDFLRFADLGIPAVSIGHALGRVGCLSAGCCWGNYAPPGTSWALKFPGPDGAPWGQSSLAFQSQITDHHLIDAVTHHLLNRYVPVEQGGAFLGQWTDTLTGMTLAQIPQGAMEVASEVAKLGHTLPVYPTQLMESLGELSIFAILLLVRKHKRFHGQVLACYAMLYACLRTTTEMFRGDEERGRIFGAFPSVPRHAWYNISTSQLISGAIFALGVAIWVRFGRRAKADLSYPSTPGGGLPAAA